MDVTTVDERGVSLQTAALYAAITVSFVGAALLPALLSWSYIRVLKTVILLVILVEIARLLVSAVVSFPVSEDPPPIEDGEQPTVSVVIPAYNEASVLEDTIEACKDLDYPDEKLEFVVCYEAACTDATGAIAERAAAEDPRFRALVGPGEGKARAINYAVERVESDVIVNIDADHHLESGAIRRAVRWFAADEDTWCVKGRCYGRNPTDSLIALYATVDRHVVEKVDLVARQVLGGFTLFSGGQVFFRRSAFEELGGYDDDVLVEDVDLSARIHAAGKGLRVDPDIVTTEEQPTTLRAWWAQRKRWARGWLQVSARHLPTIVRSRASPMAKLDAAQTFSYNLVLPFLVVGFPLPLLDFLEDTLDLFDTAVPLTAYVPYSRVIWTILGVFPVIAAGAMFLSDYREGRDHHRFEYAAALTIGFYLVVNAVVYAAAFIEEFVLRRPQVFVTTARSDER